MPTAKQRVTSRLRKVRKRLASLVGARRFRRARTLYWRTKYRQATDVDEKAVYLRRARDSAELGQTAKQTEKVLRVREARALAKIEKLKRQEPLADYDKDGVVVFDGKPVATDVGRELQRIRDAGRWKGVLVSGYRTPEYSRQLCRNMCGMDKCPGMCAGVDTNHARKGPRQGAADVSDFYTFAAECKRLNSWLENHLPRDLVHFSDSGI